MSKQEVDVRELLDAIKLLFQQQGASQVTQQQIQEAIEQVVQGSGQSRTERVTTEDKDHDIAVDEAFENKTFTDSELSGFNKKQIAASEQSERVRSLDHDLALKQVEAARAKWDLHMQQKRDSLDYRAAEQAELIKHLGNLSKVDKQINE